MSALAERWWDDETAASDAPRSAPSREKKAPPRRRHETEWNVLAEELVSYPSRAQAIWLSPPPDEEASPRAYADAWLERELARLRSRSRRALSSPSVSPSVADEVGTVAPVRAEAVHSLGRGLVLAPPSSAGEAPGRPRASRARAQQSDVAHPLPRPTSVTRGLRRLLPGAASLVVLVSLWFAAGALSSSAHSFRLARLPGSVPVAGGYAYIARPGDTVWSIAARAEPGQDPRPLADRLESEIGGQLLEPGDRLVIPG